MFNMKSTEVMFLLLLSITLTVSVYSYSINDVRVERSPSILEERLKKRASGSDTLELGSTLSGLLGALGLNGTGSGTPVRSDTIEALQNTLRSVTPSQVRDILSDTSPLAQLLDNIPLIGPILNLLRTLLGVTGTLVDRVVNLLVGVLRCVGDGLPKLLQ